jgi:putative ABC transport system permease protein
VLDLMMGTLRSLRAHALRFTLTSLGIVWGALMLTFLSASMEGVDHHFTTELEEIGPKIVFMGPGSIVKNRVGERGARAVELDGDDLERISSLNSVESASPNLEMWSKIVRAGGRTKLLHVQGVNEQSRSIRNFEVAEGRYLTRTDLSRGARVAFVGSEAAERLFGKRPVVGETIRIDSVGFRIIGVAVAKGDQLVNTGMPDDTVVLVPHTTAQRWFTRTDRVSQVVFAPRVRGLGGEAIRHARQLIGLHHNFDPDLETALWFFDLHQALKTVYLLLFGLRVFLISAGIITLLVGAVGVMNIMLVVVGERTQEIGLRKAVGASGRAIFVQFLAEAAAVCALSGLLGSALGVLLTQLAASRAPAGGPMSSPPVLDPVTVAVIAISLAAVGVVAGVVPALRAARIPPAEALRAI